MDFGPEEPPIIVKPTHDPFRVPAPEPERKDAPLAPTPNREREREPVKQ
jgi:hypothetical protein